RPPAFEAHARDDRIRILSEHFTLALELRARVEVHRLRNIGLRIVAAASVEYRVGRDVNAQSTGLRRGPGDSAARDRIHARRTLGVAFAPVDVRPGRSM